MHNGVVYDSIISPYTGKIWLDRNLGALKVCMGINDAICYGDYYQWGNEIDSNGELRAENWGSTDGTSVCPVGYRVPTISELKYETIDVNASTENDVYSEFLKLPYAGSPGQSTISSVWSSDIQGSKSYKLIFYELANIYVASRSEGSNIRCIKANGAQDINNSTSKVKQTGQVVHYLPYDDGHYRAGYTASYSRDSSKEIVIDNITKLMWQDNEDVKIVETNFTDAHNYCKNLSLGGYDDWVLPRFKELFSLYDQSSNNGWADIFVNMASSTSYYATSSSISIVNYYTVVGGYGNGIYNAIRLNDESFVRCVRGERLNEIYTRHQYDNILIDNLNNIMWQDTVETRDNKLNPSDASDYCESLSLDGYDDWYLPTSSDMALLYDQTGLKQWTDSLFYKEDASDQYITSSNFAVSGDVNWTISRNTIEYNVRCVKKDFSKVKFLDNDGILEDVSTGLMWDKNIVNNNDLNITTFDEALEYCHDLIINDYRDWRLPNINELLSITNNRGIVDDAFNENVINRIVSSTSPTHWFERDVFGFGRQETIRSSKEDVQWKSTACVRGGL